MVVHTEGLPSNTKITEKSIIETATTSFFVQSPVRSKGAPCEADLLLRGYNAIAPHIKSTYTIFGLDKGEYLSFFEDFYGASDFCAGRRFANRPCKSRPY